MSAQKEKRAEPLAAATQQPDDTVLTFEALQRSQNHLEVDADGVTLWTPEGEHYAWRSLQCDYVDQDYRTLFGVLGGFAGRRARVISS